MGSTWDDGKQVLEGIWEPVELSKLERDVVLNSRFPEVLGQNGVIFAFQAKGVCLRQVWYNIRSPGILEVSFLG